MKRYLWYPLNGILRGFDRAYQRAKRLQPVGQLLYIRKSTYEGPSRVLGKEKLLRAGESVGVIHFNNRGLQDAQKKVHGGAFVFARLMLASLADLAEAAEHDPALKQLVAFRGTTWIPPHGKRVGFEVVPLPDTWLNRLRAQYFRLLLYAFNPASSRRFRQRLRAYEFWLAREDLLRQFGPGASADDESRAKG